MNHFKAYSIGYTLQGFLKIWKGNPKYESSYKKGYYDNHKVIL
ncbi:hypothetical protein SDC9_07479 [bioreactor metagenome]|uniref:Uncharacterized protein n=1 Tax=bioreactor metagenome TaxID=1076179 RepID=A0A644T4W5_9ZZZZ|nr:hypothetical protein [Methanobrevibacter sp.]MEA4956933.1 hypothetical protein [Methanobrevibacter sp.]